MFLASLSQTPAPATTASGGVKSSRNKLLDLDLKAKDGKKRKGKRKKKWMEEWGKIASKLYF